MGIIRVVLGDSFGSTCGSFDFGKIIGTLIPLSIPGDIVFRGTVACDGVFCCEDVDGIAGGNWRRLEGEFLANQPMTLPRIFPAGAPSFLGNGVRGEFLVEKNGFFAGAVGGVHACFGANLDCGCCVMGREGAFGSCFGGIHAPELLGVELSSESSCSKKSDIIKG